MFQNWRFKLRKAEEALKAGRLDEASELLIRGDLIEYLPGKRLAGRLASRLGDRAVQHSQGEDWQSAWSDLKSAIRLGGETRELLGVRQKLIEAGFASIKQSLAAGDTNAALGLLDKLAGRQAPRESLDLFRQVTRQLQSADKLSRHGKFGDAESQLTAAIALAPDLKLLETKLDEVRTKREESRPLTEQLHRAAAEARWSDALTVADQLLELAPENRLAIDARRKAWTEVGRDPSGPSAALRTGPLGEELSEISDGLVPGTHQDRFVLWVDGVGGFLVCQSDQILLGQACCGNQIDVPIMADLSGKHARICRGGEGYWIEPLHLVRVNGRAVHSKRMLNDGDELELGSGVRIRFRRPHALSASARLEFLSRHRTQPSADGVLLMADSCVLGPRWQNHVVCRDWSGDVVLYRHDQNLYCRAMESIEIDGELCDGRGRLAGNSHVVGSDFSMSLEELDRCSTQPLL
jgi:hypothetical protein